MFLKILWLHIMYMTYIYGFKKYCNDVHLIYASVFYQMERKYYIKWYSWLILAKYITSNNLQIVHCMTYVFNCVC